MNGMMSEYMRGYRLEEYAIKCLRELPPVFHHGDCSSQADASLALAAADFLRIALVADAAAVRVFISGFHMKIQCTRWR